MVVNREYEDFGVEENFHQILLASTTDLHNSCLISTQKRTTI